jgi:hypothetical protein
MINNIELKRKKAKENQDTESRGSTVYLHPKECDYNSIII